MTFARADLRRPSATRPQTARDRAYEVAEKLGRPAWSKDLGHHVEFRTVRFEPRGEPRRVRILTADFGRIASEHDAQRVLNRIRGEIANGHQLEDVLARFVTDKLPVNLFVRRWEAFCESKLPKMRAGRLAARRVRELERYVARGYFACWVDTTVQEIRELELVEWIDGMRLRTPPLSEKTLKNVLMDVGQFFRWLAKRGVIAAAPTIPTAELVLEEYAPTIPDAHAVGLILAAIPIEHRGIFLARSYMGLRPSEARRLDVADLRDGDRALQVLARKSKKRKQRLLALPEPVRAWFREPVVIKAFGALEKRFGAEPLFPNPRARNEAHRWTEKPEWEAFKAACRAAGVPEFKPNESGRHFFGTEHVNAGVDVFAVQAWLGHSDIATTQRYAKMRPQTLARVFAMGRSGQSVDSEREASPIPEQIRRPVATPAGFEPVREPEKPRG